MAYTEQHSRIAILYGKSLRSYKEAKEAAYKKLGSMDKETEFKFKRTWSAEHEAEKQAR